MSALSRAERQTLLRLVAACEIGRAVGRADVLALRCYAKLGEDAAPSPRVRELAARLLELRALPRRVVQALDRGDAP